jgi:hypothetical protein
MNPFSKRGLRDKLATQATQTAQTAQTAQTTHATHATQAAQAANLIDEQIEISVTVRELFYKLFVV